MEKGGNEVWILGRAIYLEKGKVCGTVAGLGSWYTGRWGEMRAAEQLGRDSHLDLRDTIPAYCDEGFDSEMKKRIF